MCDITEAEVSWITIYVFMRCSNLNVIVVLSRDNIKSRLKKQQYLW